MDLGVHQDGLVHISELSHKYIQDARQAVKVGDIVKVKVIGVDEGAKRISLSMKALIPKPPRPPRRKKPEKTERVVAAGAQSANAQGAAVPSGEQRTRPSRPPQQQRGPRPDGGPRQDGKPRHDARPRPEGRPREDSRPRQDRPPKPSVVVAKPGPPKTMDEMIHHAKAHEGKPHGEKSAELPTPLTHDAIRELVSRLSDAEVRKLLIEQLDRSAAPKAKIGRAHV